MWLDPAEIAVTVFPLRTPVAVTAVGEFEFVLVEFPSCPSPLYPQQYAAPLAMAQVWFSPAEIAVTVFPVNASESGKSYGIVARSVRVPIAPITATFMSSGAADAGAAGIVNKELTTNVLNTKRRTMVFLMG